MNEILKRIEIARLDRNMSATEICKYLGINKSTYTTWRKRDTAPDVLLFPKLAEYLGVSCEYLLTGKELEMSEEERQLVGSYNGMNAEGQRLLIEYAEFLRSRYIKTDKVGVGA